MSDEVEEVEEVEEPLVPWLYGLGDVKFIEGVEVTDNYRAQALTATRSECLDYMDMAVSELSPGFRRYGGTLGKIVAQFLESRDTIKEEMKRIAHRNLRCVVTGNLGGRRVLNAGLATAEKEARDKPVEETDPAPVEETDPAPVEETDLGTSVEEKLGVLKTD